MLTNDLVFNKS